MKKLLQFVALFMLISVNAQVGIGTTSPDNSAELDIVSTSKGILIPRMTEAQRTAIASPATGLMVYQNNNTTGFYYYNGTTWTYLSSSSVPSKITDADDDTKMQVEESVDEDKIRFDMEGTEYFVMDKGRFGVTNTGQSVFIGEGAGVADDLTNNRNTAIGSYTLYSVSSGIRNTALGSGAGYNNITGNSNVFLGYDAGYNETGSNKLYIANSGTTAPLIYGDFDSEYLTVNGKFYVNRSVAAEPIATFESDDDVSVVIDGQGGESYLEITNDDTTSSNSWKVGLNDANRLDIQYGTANTMNGNTLGISVLTDGKVGVGLSDPDAELEVNGQIKISESSVTPQVGMIRWNSTTGDFEGYTGLEWISFTKTTTWGEHEVPTSYESDENSSGSQNSNFGCSVSIDNDYAVIGAVGGGTGGEAYIYYLSGGSWSQQALLTPSSASSGDNFGYSVSIDGDYAIVGAEKDDVSGNSNQGSATIFHRSGSNWPIQATLTASDGATDDFFGTSVSIDGDYAIVGAYLDDISGNSNQGSAYIFHWNGTSWTQQAKLIASDGAANDSFGNSVSINGDYVIVGALGDDISGNSNQGSAYIFHRSGTNWTQQAKLTASGGFTGDVFGNSVSIDGDYVIVGAYGASDYYSNQGAAYIFHRSGASWSEQAKLIAFDGATDDYFGNSVSICGDYVVVGVGTDDVSGNSDQGSAHIYHRTGSNWFEQARFIAYDGTTDDEFGNSVSINGNYVIVGAPMHDIPWSTDQGSVHFFKKN